MPHRIADTVVEGYPTKTLTGQDGELEVTFAPSVGMLGCSLKHQGEELLDMRGGLGEYAKSGSTRGIPLLYPWANRLSGFQYRAGGRTVDLDPESPLLHRDANGLPIHGLLGGCPHWKVTEAAADRDEARLTARLDFAAVPELLAAFPFPHELAIGARLRETTLTVETTVRATGDSAVPVSFGYHPYLQLPGTPRDQWVVHMPVERQLVLDDKMIPTGASKAVEIAPAPLENRTYDAAFGNLKRAAHFILVAGGRRLEMEFGEGYPYAQVWVPPVEEFVCLEPMTAPTNALVSGADLPFVAPGEQFTAVFSIRIVDLA